MSFNILTARSPLPRWRWQDRCDAVVDCLDGFDGDLIGLQEARPLQLSLLQHRLPGYQTVSMGRGGSPDRGEHVPVLFRKERFEKLREGHFWLSPSPDRPGSRYLRSIVPRVASWALLVDRWAGGRELLVLNTHLCCFWEGIRLRSVRLIRRRVQDLAGNGPIVITGDFNANVGEDVHRELAGADGQGVRLWDALRETDPSAQERRIDWILCSGHFGVEAGQVDRSLHHGRRPSDHWPVTAHLRWR